MGGRQQKVLHFWTLVSCLFASLSPAAAQIRLAGSGTARCSGRVEIYHNGSWGTVCDDSWDINDAKVVCRQLSCGLAMEATQSARFGAGSGQIWLDDVACSGSENSLTECRHSGFGTHDCGHGEDAGVVCSGQIRLAGSGTARCSGRVEIYHNGSWGTVCDDSWDINDAKVVCRYRDCGTALNAMTSAFFGKGTGQIWLDNVACSGSESSLTECQHRGFGTHDCGHGEDAGVVCSVSLPKPSISIKRGQVIWGQDASITCSISAEFLGGTFILKKIPGSFTQNESSGSTSATFKLQNVDFSHDGLYQCQYEKLLSDQRFSSSLSDSVRISVTVRLQTPNISLTSPNGGLVWGPEGAEVARGYSFDVTCSINTRISSGQFILTVSGSNLTEPAVNNSATFSFPVAEYKHQGNYSCVYEVTLSTRTFRSSPAAPISVIIKLPLMVLVSSVSAGIVLLLLLLLLMVCLMIRRRRPAKKPEPLIQTQMTVRVENDYMYSDDEDDDEDYVNVDLVNTNENIKGRAAVVGVDEEGSNDYVESVSDNDHDYEEAGPNDNYKKPMEACANLYNLKEDYEQEVSDDGHDYEEAGPNDSYTKSKETSGSVDSHREAEAEDEEETSDDENDYENVASPSPSVDNVEEKETSDDENDYENVASPSPSVDNAEEKETSDDENDYENVSPP